MQYSTAPSRWTTFRATTNSVPILNAPIEQPKAEKPKLGLRSPGVGDYARVALNEITELPGALYSSAVTAVQGQSGVEAPGQGDFFEESARGIRKGQVAKQQDIAKEFPESTGIKTLSRLAEQGAFSLTAMVPGLTAGIATAPAAALPIPGAQAAPFVAGGAASGVAAFRAASGEIMGRFIETLDEEKRQTGNQGLTPEEVEAAKKKFSDRATKYGLWEAIPEAIGNAVAGRLIFGPLVKVAGAKVARTMLSKLGIPVAKAAAVAAEELATETVTQVGQEQTTEGTAVGVPEGTAKSFTSPSDIVDALGEVAPDTLLLVAVLGGGIKGGQLVAQRRAETKLAKELGVNKDELRARIKVLQQVKAAKP